MDIANHISDYGIADVIGMCGSVIFLLAFIYANRVETMNKLLFNAANLAGAIMLLISLWVKFNLAAFVLEAAWAVIALVGLVAALRDRRRTSQ
jgi:hypothetical protein